MSNISDLSDAQITILATHLAGDNNLENLQQLQAHRPKVLNGIVILRTLLTFLPESIEPSTYTPLLSDLATASSVRNSEITIDVSSVKELDHATARQRVRKLHLLPLTYTPSNPTKAELAAPNDIETDLLVSFLVHRAYRIDAETGLLPLVLQLIEPFICRSEDLRSWVISSLLPLLRLNYEYYPENETFFSLETFKALDVNRGLAVLLPQGIDGDRQVARDLRGLVGPWVYGKSRSKRRKVTNSASEEEIRHAFPEEGPFPVSVPTWAHINDWIVQQSRSDFSSGVKIFEDWRGPSDVDLGGYEDDTYTTATMDNNEGANNGYAQAALRCIISTNEDSRAVNDGSYRLLLRATEIAGLDRPPEIPDSLSELPKVRLGPIAQQPMFYDESIPLKPTTDLIEYLFGVIVSCRVLHDLDYPMSCHNVALLPTSLDYQELEMKRLLDKVSKSSRSSQNWSQARSQLFWLRDWEDSKVEIDAKGESRKGFGIFGLMNKDELDKEILRAVLKAEQYNMAVELYVDEPTKTLSANDVEAIVANAILNAYDNASNCNRTRGGLKRASDMLRTFHPKFPGSATFRHIDALLAATHSLSFYSLTLQHGVPFKPVNIRVHQDPIDLVRKVLEQNSKSYTKLDDLLSIGRSLINAGLPNPPDHAFTDASSFTTEHQVALTNTERRITSLAISAALNENDFGTAYSYIITRLSPQQSLKPSDDDDISWRAAYNTARHHPAGTMSQSPTLQLQTLTQRLELLSLALVLAPTPKPLPEILASWRRCDEEMNALRAREAEEDASWDASGKGGARSTTLPGAFSAGDSPTLPSKSRPPAKGGYNEEAPMGLFDVARGAARALGKTAFPLRGQNATSGVQQPQTRPRDAETRTSDESERDMGVEGRVRKRDMVSNLVTGGLASGLGWVLGAQPVGDNKG